MKVNSMALRANRVKRTELDVDNFLDRRPTCRFTERGVLRILRRFEWRCQVCVSLVRLDQAKVGEEEQPAQGHLEKLVKMVVRLRVGMRINHAQYKRNIRDVCQGYGGRRSRRYRAKPEWEVNRAVIL